MDSLKQSNQEPQLAEVMADPIIKIIMHYDNVQPQDLPDAMQSCPQYHVWEERAAA